MNYSTRRLMSEALQTGKLSEEQQNFVNGSPVPAVSSPAPAEVKPSADSKITGTISMTFRLPAALSGRLGRVSAERKLQRQRPFSQQDIVAEALDEWLKRNSGSM